ncbi:MAG TPA: PTS sugar transporter subunit IIA [Firmicutes bacterium]|nr:PTS sugar transporter subunit IIA [Bacillota bacterium]
MGLTGKTKDEILKEMVEVLSNSGNIKDPNRIYEAVVERERLCSTGFEHGVAIPHPRQGQPDIVENLTIAFGSSKNGVDFEALDEEPVYIFFMLAAPNDQEHLRALARLSRMLKKEEFREELNKAKTPDDVLKLISKREEELS